MTPSYWILTVGRNTTATIAMFCVWAMDASSLHFYILMSSHTRQESNCPSTIYMILHAQEIRALDLEHFMRGMINRPD